MNIRIISGIHGSRKIAAPQNDRTHPMGERVRNALFNQLSAEIQGAVVLDAFAGTGSLGLEALSRGAKRVVFVEKDRIAQKVLAQNIATLGEENRSKIIRTTVSNWLETMSDVTGFDIIFVDPPYHDPQFSTVRRLFALLKPQAYMVLSHQGKGEIPTQTGVVVVDNRSYGGANLTIYRRES